MRGSSARQRFCGAGPTVVRTARAPNSIVALHLPATETTAAVVTLDLCVQAADAPTPPLRGNEHQPEGVMIVKSMARDPVEPAAKTLERVRLLFASPGKRNAGGRKTTREELLASCPPLTVLGRAVSGEAASTTTQTVVEVDTSLPNSEFWARVDTIQIGSRKVTIRYNVPTITSVVPPSRPFVGLPLVCSNVTCVFAGQQDLQYEWCLPIADDAMGRNDVKVLSRARAFVPTSDLLEKRLVLRVTADAAAGLWTQVELAPVQQPPPAVDRWAETASDTAFPAFRTVTYNILYDDFCTSKSCKTKIYPFATDEVLDIENRQVRILQELLAYRADLICLQECGKRLFQNYLLPAMDACGYGSFYANKSGTVQEGCGFFYRRSRFSLVSTEWLPMNWETLEAREPALAAEVSAHAELKEALENVTSIGAILTLREIGSGKELILGNTHLFYHANACHIRILQTHLLLSCLQRAAGAPSATDGNRGSENARARPIVLCGDCNFTHATGAYQLVTTGQVEDTHRSWEKGKLFWWGCDRQLGYSEKQLAELMAGDEGASAMHAKSSSTKEGEAKESEHGEKATKPREPLATFFHRDLRAALRLADAYGRMDPNMPWTNFTLTFREVIDYIFFSEESLDVLRTVPIPPEAELAENYALPNSKYPSDHVALISDLAFK